MRKAHFLGCKNCWGMVEKSGEKVSGSFHGLPKIPLNSSVTGNDQEIHHIAGTLCC